MFHFEPFILLAIDIGELIGSVIGLAALLLWVIKQVVEANKEAGPAKARPAAAPQQQAQPQAAVNPAGQQADPLRHQVEEFLRRTGRGPQGNQPGGPQRRAWPGGMGDVELLVEEDASPERRPSTPPLRSAERTASAGSVGSSAAQPRPRKPVAPRRQTVAEHVAESIGAHSREVGEQASRLGQGIIADDHQFDVQLEAKFDHQVGTLTGSAVAAAEQAEIVAARLNSPAAQIAALLANPAGVRQAIIMNEILRPPIDRW
jgi:hypothetical protein